MAANNEAVGTATAPRVTEMRAATISAPPRATPQNDGRRLAVSAYSRSRATSLIVSEGWAVVIEWGVYFVAFPGMKPGRALGVSAFANGVSFAIGLVLYQFTGWLS